MHRRDSALGAKNNLISRNCQGHCQGHCASSVLVCIPKRMRSSWAVEPDYECASVYWPAMRRPPSKGFAHSLQRAISVSQPQVVDGEPISRWPRQLLLPVCCLTTLGSGSPCDPPKTLKAPVIHPGRELFLCSFPSPAHRSKWPDVPGLYPPTPLSDLIASIPRPPRSPQNRLGPALAPATRHIYPRALIFRISHL